MACRQMAAEWSMAS